MQPKIKAACGLDCANCPAYIARETNDDSLRAKTAEEWNVRYNANFTAKEINCVGCMVEGIHSGYCFACPIRECVQNKKLPYCFACTDFKDCQKRKVFEEQAGLKMEDFFA